MINIRCKLLVGLMLVGGLLNAQITIDSITGIWRASYGSWYDVYEFKADTTFEHVNLISIEGVLKAEVKGTGRFAIENGCVLLFDDDTTKTTTSSLAYNIPNCLVETDSDTLVFEHKAYGYLWKGTYLKVENKLEDIVVKSEVVDVTKISAGDIQKFINSWSYFKRYYLVNSLDTNYRILIDTDVSSFEISYESQLQATDFNWISVYATGVIDSVTNDSVFVNADYVSTMLTNDYNGNTVTSTTAVAGENINESKLALALENDLIISYSSPGRFFVNNLGIILFSGGITTAFMIAPFLSINYSNGDFKEDRYYRIAGYSLSVATLGIPLVLLSQPRNYAIIPKGDMKADDKWYLE